MKAPVHDAPNVTRPESSSWRPHKQRLVRANVNDHSPCPACTQPNGESGSFVVDRRRPERYGSGMLGQNATTQVIPGYEDKLVVTMDEPKTKACRASKGQRLN
jgi:hypothetical protein